MLIELFPLQEGFNIGDRVWVARPEGKYTIADVTKVDDRGRIFGFRPVE